MIASPTHVKKNVILHVRFLVHLHFDVFRKPASTGRRSIVLDRDGLELQRPNSHACSRSDREAQSHFSNVDVGEVEHILSLFLERILSTFGLLQVMLNDLVLLAVERDEHFRFGVRAWIRIGLRGDGVVDAYNRINPMAYVSDARIAARTLVGIIDRFR